MGAGSGRAVPALFARLPDQTLSVFIAVTLPPGQACFVLSSKVWAISSPFTSLKCCETSKQYPGSELGPKWAFSSLLEQL